MAIYNREDPRTTLPQLEKTLKKIEDIIDGFRQKFTTRKVVINGETKSQADKSNIRIDVTSTLIDGRGSAPSSPIYDAGIQVNDKNGDRIGRLESFYNTSDRIGLGIVATRYINGSPVHNNFNVYVNADGTLGYGATNPAALRAAIMTPTMIVVTAFTSGKITQAANSGTDLEQTITVPSGYDFVGVVGFSCSHNIASSVGSARRTATNKVKMSTTNRTSAQWTDQTHTVYAMFVLSNLF